MQNRGGYFSTGKFIRIFADIMMAICGKSDSKTEVSNVERISSAILHLHF